MTCACTGRCRLYGSCSGGPVSAGPVYDPPFQRHWYEPPVLAYPQGCVCPPTSERTCMNQLCPRKAIDMAPRSVSPTNAESQP